MEQSPLTVPEFEASAIVERLERLAAADADAGLAFDADGTLWTGDVGEAVFEYAIERGLLREEAEPALREQAERFGCSETVDASSTARSLYSLYQSGVYPERQVCEMMVWCYAGMSEAELKELTEEALRASDLRETINRSVWPIIEWARKRGVRTVVISASPALVVHRAAAELGFQEHDIFGGRASLDGERICPEMREPLPYGPGKADVGRRALGSTRWLASCGDSIFDLDMMLSADLAVGVRPKADLTKALAQVSDAVILKHAD